MKVLAISVLLVALTLGWSVRAWAQDAGVELCVQNLPTFPTFELRHDASTSPDFAVGFGLARRMHLDDSIW